MPFNTATPKSPLHLCPPADHNTEEFRDWCVKVKEMGYADQYIAAIADESVNKIRRILGVRKKKR